MSQHHDDRPTDDRPTDEEPPHADEARATGRTRAAAARVVERGRAAARDRLGDARERFQGATRERYDETVVQLREGYDQVRDNVEGAADDLSDYVRIHPGKTILIAALAGFVLGLAFRTLDDGDNGDEIDFEAEYEEA